MLFCIPFAMRVQSILTVCLLISANYCFALTILSYNISLPSFSWVPSLTSSTLSLLSIPFTSFDVGAIRNRTDTFYGNLSKTILEDSALQVPELIKKYGYPCETHTVVTPDGYIVTMHRIPYGRNGSSEDNKNVVFLQHGILMSSADWLIAGPNKALGYLLADAGYDVWLANSRGNTYSRNHIHLNTKSKSYWDFSWHEIAIYDVTTMIDYTLNYTKQQELFYIGHSQGTTVFYVMCSEKPEYNNRIKAMFSLSPIAYMTDSSSLILQLIASFEKGFDILLDAIGAYEFLPNSEILAIVGNAICKEDSITQVLCTNSLFAIGGFGEAQMNITLLPIIMKHTPAGSSTKQFLHYAQQVNSGEFHKWDYGSSKNIEHYGNETAPRYHLEEVKTPVYLFYSKSDWLSGEKDVKRLQGELKNVKGMFLVNAKDFNHLDYLFGIDAPELVHKHILALLKTY